MKLPTPAFSSEADAGEVGMSFITWPKPLLSLRSRYKRGRWRSGVSSSGTSLTRALPVPFGLVRIHFSHALQEILRIRLLHIRRFGPTAVPLLRSPRCRSHRSLSPFRHGLTLK